MRRAVPLLILTILAVAGAPSAFGQFGSVFGNDPPRPPGSIPGGQAPAPQQRFPQPPPYPGQPYPPAIPQQQALPPAQTSLPAPQPGPALRGGIQGQPLPPPPGATAAPPLPPASGTAALPPQQAPAANPAAPANANPTDEVVVEPPAQKIANAEAVFSGLDKITGRIISFDVKIGETVQFGALQVTPRACYTRPPTVASNTDGFVEVDEVTLQGEIKRIFTGWMFISSPGLHAVEHPIYDVWLTDCKSPEQPAVAAVAGPAPPPARPQPQQRAPSQSRAAPAPSAAPGLPPQRR